MPKPLAADAGTGARRPLGRGMALVMALACGAGVANVYFPQAITPLITSGLGVSPDTAALVVRWDSPTQSTASRLLSPRRGWLTRCRARARPTWWRAKLGERC